MSADITTLYPKIPIDTALVYINNLLHDEKTQHILHDKNEIKFIITLLNIVLHNCYINVNNKIYLQIKGTAMGTPCAVVFANLFLIWHNNIILKTYNNITTPISQHRLLPYLYKRFIDDIFMIFPNKLSAINYLKSFNNILNDIKICNPQISNTSVDILDITITINNIPSTEIYTLNTTLYSKPCNTHPYLCPYSNHLPHIFHNWIKNEIIRIRITCNIDDEFDKHIQIFYNNLLTRGYTVESLKPLFDSIQFNIIKVSRDELINKRIHKIKIIKTNPPTFVTLLSSMSQLLINKDTIQPTNEIILFEKHNIFKEPVRIAYKNHPNLARLLIKNVNDTID